MDAVALLTESFSRLPALARVAVEGLTPQQLTTAPADGTNPIGWLVWHLARGQDAQIADVAGTPQVYLSGGWAARFGREPDASDTGYGHDAAAVRSVQPESAQSLLDYLDAVHAATLRYLGTLTGDDLDRVVDEAWDPPVTLGVRLVSIVDDDVQHAGQAAYARGMLGA
ncbi:DinB family protein [Agrococcus sp. ARC_14]|uniref:mycothiol transferase n=1 Tax=Agrococcus sp. ARC_14 TaxID=2919927 RepID=UPI001F06CB7C|nr:DinB family protein [Agrococcus sp. ARC_14]MCH1882790.1 DinB family protein [Agrococcus sp. ARC_14]